MITGKFAVEEHFVQGFEEQMYGGKMFSRIFHVPDKCRERLSFRTVRAWMLGKERFCTERF